MSKINLNINEMLAEKKELSDFLSDPSAYAHPDYSSKNKRFTELETLISLEERRTQLQQNIKEARELAGGDDELAELAKEDLASSETELARLEDDLFVMLTPKDPNDEKNIIVEI